jgi:excisionase family DNA binding protein
MPATAEPDQLYRLEEAAERLRIASHTLRHWCLSGRVSYHRIGAQLMLLQSDIDAFVRSSRVPAK